MRIDETASTTLETIPFFAAGFRLAVAFGIGLFVVTDRLVRDADAPLFVERVFDTVVFALPLALTVVRDVEVLDLEAAPLPDFVDLLFEAAVFDLDETVVFGAFAFKLVLDLEDDDFDFIEDALETEDDALAFEDGEDLGFEVTIFAFVVGRGLDIEVLEPDLDLAVVFVAAITFPPFIEFFCVLLTESNRSQQRDLY